VSADGAASSSSVLDAIRAAQGRLPSGEARVAQVILEQPFAATAWSAQELADRAETSSPTVVRACRRLGFSGLPELRLALARDVGWARLVTEADAEADGDEDAVTAMFTRTLRAVDDTAHHLDLEAFDRATTLLAEARRILFVCAGPTQIVCRDAVFDLLSVGRSAEFADDVIVQRILATQLRAGDVCVAVGVSGENELTIRAAEDAQAAGAAVLAVTSTERSSLARVGDVSIHLAGDAPRTSATAVLVSMLIAFRAMTAVIARREGTTHPAPLAQIIDPSLIRAGRPGRARPRQA
jgi:RpiR family transcriptional regulator, carbohydrate utilization regulator